MRQEPRLDPPRPDDFSDTRPSLGVEAPDLLTPDEGAPLFLGVGTAMLPLLLAALGSGAVLFGVFRFADPESRLFTLLFERGFTQYLTLGIFFWGLGHVLRRALVQWGEHRALDSCRRLLKSRPLERETVPRLMGALFPLRRSLAGPMLSNVLSYFRAQRPTRDEVLKVAHREVERAEERIEGDYAALSACMWLLPLSGFLGTVVGMGEAIGSFDALLSNGGSDLSVLAPAVAGLSTAFDTTLLGLVLVAPLKLLEVGLSGRDQRLVAELDRNLGPGLVRELDLGVVAQHSPEEAALLKFAEGMERVERNLSRIDQVLALTADRLAKLPDASQAIEDFAAAARIARAALPKIEARLANLEAQGERPLTVVRNRSEECRDEPRTLRVPGERP